LNLIINYHELISNHLASETITTSFLSYNPFEKNSLNISYQNIIESGEYERAKLSNLLLNYNQQISNDPFAIKNCDRLKQNNSTVIITGQQSGMLTGPLYTVYKIITALNLAYYCELKFGTPVIPLFWNATEDHDLSEVESFFYPDKQWRANFGQHGCAAQSLNTDPACTRLIHEFLESIPAINHKEEITDIISCNSKNYGEFSSSVIARLFQGTGLVVMEPRLLRGMGKLFFQACLEKYHLVTELLSITANQLHEKQIQPSFTSENGATGLFWINKKGIRQSIKEENENFYVNSSC